MRLFGPMARSITLAGDPVVRVISIGWIVHCPDPLPGFLTP